MGRYLLRREILRSEEEFTTDYTEKDADFHGGEKMFSVVRYLYLTQFEFFNDDRGAGGAAFAGGWGF